jgi:hypothetical protein
VLVFAGNDNVRDSWWSYGDADMLERAMLVGYRSGFYTDEELTTARSTWSPPMQQRPCAFRNPGCSAAPPPILLRCRHATFRKL